MENYIKVLWVEDDPRCMESFPREAEHYGLELVSFPCWDEAEVELKNKYDDYSAIILDAKCKKSKDSEDDAQVFLSNVFHTLPKIMAKNCRNIPWFILSGGDKAEFGRIIPEDRKEWDDHKENYYKKTSDKDREALYTRIQQIAIDSDSVKIKKDLYPDVFKAIRDCELPQHVSDNMVELLRPIHFPKVSDSDNYNKNFGNARQIVEYVFRNMIVTGYIPREGHINNGKVNLAACKNYLINNLKPSAPKIVTDYLYKIIYVTGSYLHVPDEENEKNYKTELYLKQVNKSPYLLRSFAMYLCDLILWYQNFRMTQK